MRYICDHQISFDEFIFKCSIDKVEKILYKTDRNNNVDRICLKFSNI